MRIEELILDKDIVKLDTILRWNLNQTIKTENVSQHSFWVSFYATCLSEEIYGFANDKMKLGITRYALFHDLDEVFSGDVDHNVKNNPTNGDKLKELLDEYSEVSLAKKFKSKNSFNEMIIRLTTNHTSMLRGEVDIIKAIVKICDWLSFIKYLDNEIALGNSSVINVRDYCRDGIINQVEKTKLLDIPNKEVLDQLIMYV